jgi:hypothetical protein
VRFKTKDEIGHKNLERKEFDLRMSIYTSLKYTFNLLGAAIIKGVENM